jgi:hypothetical protein
VRRSNFGRLQRFAWRMSVASVARRVRVLGRGACCREAEPAIPHHRSAEAGRLSAGSKSSCQEYRRGNAARGCASPIESIQPQLTDTNWQSSTRTLAGPHIASRSSFRMVSVSPPTSPARDPARDCARALTLRARRWVRAVAQAARRRASRGWSSNRADVVRARALLAISGVLDLHASGPAGLVREAIRPSRRP